MKNHGNGSVDVFETVQIVFIILKLFNLIQLDWWQVFIPTYISIVIAAVLIVIFRMGGL